MSFAYPLVVAFSQNQLAAPVTDRIKDIESALLYLQRERVSAFDASQTEVPLSSQLQPFLRQEFYNVVRQNRAGVTETSIPAGPNSRQQLDYALSGNVVRVALTQEQQETIKDFGFIFR